MADSIITATDVVFRYDDAAADALQGSDRGIEIHDRTSFFVHYTEFFRREQVETGILLPEGKSPSVFWGKIRNFCGNPVDFPVVFL